jgi:hypothetical protein
MKASRCGLVVKAEDSRLRSLGFKSPLRRPLFIHHSFLSKHGTKEIMESFEELGIVACAVIAQMEGWNLSMVGL